MAGTSKAVKEANYWLNRNIIFGAQCAHVVGVDLTYNPVLYDLRVGDQVFQVVGSTSFIEGPDGQLNLFRQEKTLTVDYYGDVLGMNEALRYSRTVPKRFAKIKDTLQKLLLAETKPPRKGMFEQFRLELWINTGHDVDNPAPMAKAFADAIVKNGMAAEDKKEIYAGVEYKPTPVELPQGVKIRFYVVGY